MEERLAHTDVDRQRDRERQGQSCVCGRPSGTSGDRDTHGEKEAEFQVQ